MAVFEESDVVSLLPSFDSLSLDRMPTPDRRVLADLIRDECDQREAPDEKVAWFQSAMLRARP